MTRIIVEAWNIKEWRVAYIQITERNRPQKNTKLMLSMVTDAALNMSKAMMTSRGEGMGAVGSIGAGTCTSIMNIQGAGTCTSIMMNIQVDTGGNIESDDSYT